MHPFGVIGLGRIGGGLAAQALEKGYRVVGYDPAGASEELVALGLETADSDLDVLRRLPAPRVVFLYVHAGALVDEILGRLTETAEPGDLLIDGGNSYWGDSIRRGKRLAEKGLEFVDLGTSGGVSGARQGGCFMAGCSEAAWTTLEPILRDLAVPGGVVRAGGSGAGHFVKLVHNGVEFGMLQAIGEGVDLLERFENGEVDVAATLECWRHGSIVRSYLVDLMAEAYARHQGMEPVPNYIEDTGEVNWLVADALRLEVPTPVITQSVIQLFASRDERQTWARAVAAMRHGFGGHPYGPDERIAHERKVSRVGEFGV